MAPARSGQRAVHRDQGEAAWARRERCERAVISRERNRATALAKRLPWEDPPSSRAEAHPVQPTWATAACPSSGTAIQKRYHPPETAPDRSPAQASPAHLRPSMIHCRRAACNARSSGHPQEACTAGGKGSGRRRKRDGLSRRARSRKRGSTAASLGSPRPTELSERHAST